MAGKAPASASPVQHLQRHAAAELLANDLRNEILDGRLRPGQSLREVDLTKRYGVARNTVREALRLLTRDGLGTHQVHRGVTVRVFTSEEVDEIFDLRRVLEGTTALRAGTLTDTERTGLEDVLVASEAAFLRGDDRAGLNANMAFHRGLVRLTGNERMNEVFAQLLTEIRLILASMEDRSGGHWVGRNRDLLRNLVDGNPEAFKQNLADYVEVARAEATDVLPA